MVPFKVISTTTKTDIPGCIAMTDSNHLSIMNRSDGDVEVYAGPSPYPIIICPSNVALAFDEFTFQGQISIKNSTGGGGPVYIHIWKRDNR